MQVMSWAKQHIENMIAIKVLLAFYDDTRKAQRFGYDSTWEWQLEKINYERIIEDFISKNAQRIKFFK